MGELAIHMFAVCNMVCQRIYRMLLWPSGALIGLIVPRPA